jgi:hypothetical protein
MKLEFKMFTFQGSPVYFKLWFLLLFAWVSPSIVVAIFLSVLVHELAHAAVANRLGYNVRQIYIDLFYGAAEIDLDHCPERDAIQIVGAGPISNLLLGIVSFGLYAGTGIPFLTEMLLDNEKYDLFERYRALFTLREINTEEAVVAMCVGIMPENSQRCSELLKHEVAFVVG